MANAARWWRYLRFWGPNVRADVDEELAYHLALRTQDLTAEGMPAPLARREAERQFGDLRTIRDACITIDERRARRSHRREVLTGMRQDLGYAVRALRSSPGFTVTALMCVALGIGVTTTIFSAVNAILLRPLPYPDAERLVAVYSRLAARDEHGINISYSDYLSWRDQNRTFTQLGMYTWSTNTLSGSADAERVSGAEVTANLFPLLGVAPMLGRPFNAADEVCGNDRVILLGYGLWQRRYASDRGIVGRTITVDRLPYTVIGVMPPQFSFPDRGQAWVPFTTDHAKEGHGNRGYAGAIGRLKPGITIQRAQADLDVISARLEREVGEENLGWDAEAVSLRDDYVGDLRRPLYVLLGAVGFVLLIASANVANLMLSRGASRQLDVAIRVALGAGRMRVVRQVLIESMLIAVAGGLLGLLLARAGVAALAGAFPNFPAYVSLDLDRRVLAFALCVSAVTGILFGMVPALRATRVDFNTALKEGGRGGEALSRSRFRNGLVVAEIALSLMLLIGAGLLLRSYRALLTTDLGFQERGVLSARVTLPETEYQDSEKRRGFYETLYARLAAIPGVASVGSAQGTPFSGWNVQMDMTIEGHPARAAGDGLVIHYQTISPGYFPTIGVPIIKGRGFTAADRDSATNVGVINETLARREFANVDPIGKRIKAGKLESTSPWITIVGVARDFRHYRLPTPMGPAIYSPQLASPEFTQTLVLRTSLLDPMALAPAMRGVLRSLDANVPAYAVQTLADVVSRSLWRQRLQGQVLGAFAGLALLLAAVGLYGVISYAVAQRTREVGVRIALGATRRDVVAMVLWQGSRLAALGLAIGAAGALALSRVVAGLLYNVRPNDPATFVSVAAILAGVALLACYVPARRASRTDPLVAMRTD
jgi:putative ABC transport system permease protein